MTKRRSVNSKSKRPGHPKQWMPGRGKKARGSILHWVKSHDSVKDALPQYEGKGRPVGFGSSGEIMVTLAPGAVGDEHNTFGIRVPTETKLFTEHPVPTQCLPKSPEDIIIVAGREVWWAVWGKEDMRFPTLLAAVIGLKMMKEETEETITIELIKSTRDHLNNHAVDAGTYMVHPDLFQSDEEVDDDDYAKQ